MRHVVAVLALVALLGGSLAHTHAGPNPGANHGCTACALHDTSAAAPAVPDITAPDASPLPAPPTLTALFDVATSVLSVAPKTSPPARA